MREPYRIHGKIEKEWLALALPNTRKNFRGRESTYQSSRLIESSLMQ